MKKYEKASQEVLKLEKKSKESWNFDEKNPHIWCIYGPYIEESFIKHIEKEKTLSPSLVSCHYDHTHFGYSSREESTHMGKIIAKMSIFKKNKSSKITVEPNLKIRKDKTIFKPEPFRFLVLNKKGWDISQFICKNKNISFDRLQRSFKKTTEKQLMHFIEEAVLLQVFRIT